MTDEHGVLRVARLRLDCGRGDRHQHDAAGFGGLGPLRDAIDRSRQCRGDADSAAAFARQRFELAQCLVDMNARRYRVEDDLGLRERQVVGAGDLAGEAAR